VPLVRAPLDALGVDPPLAADGDLPLLVSRDVADALLANTARSLDVERADLLTGKVVQTPDGRVAVMVTGRTPATTAAVASRSHFAFSPETFVAAREEVRREHGGAAIVGWHHNHPPSCGRECLAVIPACATSTLFFSAPSDHAVHRSSFPAAYMVALVSGKEAGQTADRPGLRAWGWRDGAIAARELIVF
jgi:hypothetical protein